MKIYTKTGDAGQTSLFSGRRVSKDDLRVEAYGTVDELNACLGILRDQLMLSSASKASSFLLEQQRLLFSLGASLADDREEAAAYTFPETAVPALEAAIDHMQAALPKMTHFILPGGHPVVSYAHLARTVCRRAERRCVSLEGETDAVVYLNRLSDYLFVLGRYLGMELGVAEVKWES